MDKEKQNYLLIRFKDLEKAMEHHLAELRNVIEELENEKD